MMISTHYLTERQERETIINNCVSIGNIIHDTFWDRGHRDGAEIHHVTDTGVIIIENANTHRIVTKYVARPGQIRRLYMLTNEVAPYWLIKKAIAHVQSGYNLV